MQEAPGVNKGYDYARTGNPTRATLENIIAKLENGSTGIAFGSGLAAIDAVIKLLKAGDEILAVDDIYGGAFRLFTHIYEKFGIKVNYVDTTNARKCFQCSYTKNKTHLDRNTHQPNIKNFRYRSHCKNCQGQRAVYFAWIILLLHPPYSNLFRWELIL